MKPQNPQAAALVEEVRAFVSTLDPLPYDADLERHFHSLVRVQRQLHAAGLAVVSWPVKYGGRGLGPADGATVSWQLGREGCPEVINFLALEVVAPGLMQHATDEQLERWLPAMAPAEEIWCQLFSEPDAGSDLASLRTVAEQRDDGSYRATGTKVWSTWAQFADRGLLLARTGPLDTKHRGISAFVVDMHTPGITVRPLRSMTGSVEFAEVILEDVEIAAENMVGEPGDGWAIAMSMLSAERGTYPIRRSSVLSAALARLRTTVVDRTLTETERLGIVDATIALQLLEWRTDALVASLEQGHTLGPETGMTKMLLTQAEQSIRAAAFDALGADGLIGDPATAEVTEDWLYSRAASIYGGSAQIQRNILGERMLGLPRS
ncbi:MAG: acyl-CoA dehydrogenase family protein [Ilumatobacteraceae bacterium]